MKQTDNNTDGVVDPIKTAYRLARAAVGTKEERRAIDFFYNVHLNSYPGIDQHYLKLALGALPDEKTIDDVNTVFTYQHMEGYNETLFDIETQLRKAFGEQIESKEG